MRSCKNVFQSIGTIPATNESKFLLRHIFPSVGVISVFYFSPFNKCAEVPRYFDLQFPKDMMLSVLHMPICRLCIIFSKMSIHVFCPFFNWVVCFCFESSLYIVDVNPLSDQWFADILSQRVACFFIFFVGLLQNKSLKF